MTAPEVFQVRDGDGWEVYVTNPAGGWWLLSDVGGSRATTGGTSATGRPRAFLSRAGSDRTTASTPNAHWT